MDVLHGFGRYTRFIARRERLTSSLWLLGLVSITAMVTALYPSIFPTREELLGLASTLSTPAMWAIMGPTYGLEAVTPTMLMAQEMLLFIFLGIAVMNIFLINRHTRGDEERGRLEMLRGLPLGRMTNAASALFAAFLVNLAISVAMALSLLAVNAEGTTLAGAMVFSFSVGAVGLLFAAVTLLCAQVLSTERGVSAAAFAVLVMFYLMRASGDVNDGVLSYISPLGLGLRVYSFYQDNVWPILVILLEALVIGAAALAVCARRDLGAGVIAAREGRAHAKSWMLSPMGLIWRLSRGGLFGWALAFLLLGFSYGAVVGDLGAFLGSNEFLQQMMGTDLSATAAEMAGGYIGMVFMLMSLVASVPVITAASKALSEERRGRLEQIYGCAISRKSVFFAGLTVAAVASAVMPFVLALGTYLASAGTGLIRFGTYLGAAMSYSPALLTMGGLTALLNGLWPKLKGLVWVMFGYTFLVLYLGRMFKDLPELLAKLTPYGHIRQLPTQEFSALPLIILTVTAAALMGVGLYGYRNRDIG